MQSETRWARLRPTRTETNRRAAASCLHLILDAKESATAKGDPASATTAVLGCIRLAMLSRGTLWSPVSPGHEERFADRPLLCRSQPHVRGSLAPPAALDGLETLGLDLSEELLIVRRELHHAPVRVRCAERCENLSAHSKVRVTHVRRLDDPGKAESHLSKIAWRHRRANRQRGESPGNSTNAGAY